MFTEKVYGFNPCTKSTKMGTTNDTIGSIFKIKCINPCTCANIIRFCQSSPLDVSLYSVIGTTFIHLNVHKELGWVTIHLSMLPLCHNHLKKNGSILERFTYLLHGFVMFVTGTMSHNINSGKKWSIFNINVCPGLGVRPANNVRITHP